MFVTPDCLCEVVLYDLAPPRRLIFRILCFDETPADTAVMIANKKRLNLFIENICSPQTQSLLYIQRAAYSNPGLTILKLTLFFTWVFIVQLKSC